MKKNIIPKKHEKKVTPIEFAKSKEKEQGFDIRITSKEGEIKQLVFEKTFEVMTGVKDQNLSSYILSETAVSLSNTIIDQNKALNIAAQSLHNMEPQDIFEAQLCSQALALYHHGMRYLTLGMESEKHKDYYSNTAIKLLRLHNETIDAINKHRRGGEQKLIVQHVQVNDGGKAVVSGNIETKEGVN